MARNAPVAAALPLSLLGSEFVLESGDPDVLAGLGRLLAGFVVPARGEPGVLPVPRGPAPQVVRVASGADTGRALAGLNAAALAAADCLAVHAGAVAAAGRVVAFPAASGVGKSTLTVACLRQGLDYVSDEALCLDWDSGAVIPYPRPMALSGWTASALGVGAAPGPCPAETEVLLAAADVGADTATAPLRLEHLVLPVRSAGPAGLQPVARGDVVAELLRRSFTAWRRPERAFVLAHQVASAATTWRLTLGDPRDAAALLAALVPADRRPG